MSTVGANLRPSGIEVIGDVPWGTHFCQFYATKEDLTDTLVPYFRVGLEHDEFCMWVTAPPLEAAEAWSALAEVVPDLDAYRTRGRIEVIPYTDWYLRGGSFDQQRALKGWVDKLEEALDHGCVGMRLAGNTFWLENASWQSFAQYEAAVENALGELKIIALCTYSLQRCGAAEIADVVKNHQFALLKRDGVWELIESFDRWRMQESHAREIAIERERLAVTLESIGDAVIATDAAGRVMMLNRAAEELTRWTHSAAAGRPLGEVFRIVNEKTGAPAADPVARVLEAGVVVGLANHTALITRYGARRSIEDSAAPIRDRNGETIGVVLVFRDVTDARCAEERLRESEERLRRAQEMGHLGSWELDAENRRMLWSDEVYRIYGFEPQEIEVTPGVFLDAVHPHDRTATLAAYAASLQAGSNSCEVEHRIVRRSTGEVRVVHEKCEHVRDALGRVVRSVGMVQDITERKLAEQALREADRHKNEFLALLSHELRNPLAPIRNCLHVLDHAPAGSEQARHAQAVIRRQVDQLSCLVDDLLDMTHVTESTIRLRRQALELNELVRQAAEDQRTLFEENKSHLVLELAPQPVWVQADAMRITQVIGNLLQNAAKFTLAGGATTITVDAADANWATISVTDTGVGMSPETVACVFQPFVQADKSLDRSKGGLGLGLALVKGLVELHGGTVHARSEGLGKGTQVVVSLPRVAAPAPSTSLVRSRDAARARRVLVIEDNVDAADSLRQALELSDHVVEVAYDGLEGLARAREFRPEVVLCDIGLPEMDGYEVARAFRADGALRNILLVALSGYARPEDVLRATEAGFQRHIAKPPSLQAIEELLGTLEQPAGLGIAGAS